MNSQIILFKKYFIPVIVVFLFSKIKAESNDLAFIDSSNYNFLQQNDFDLKYHKAKKLYEEGNHSKSLEIAYDLLKNENILIKIKVNLLLGKILKSNNDYVSAYKYFKSALTLLETVEQSNGLDFMEEESLDTLKAEILSGVASAGMEINNENYIDYFKRLVDITTLNENILHGKGKAYNNLAVNEIENKNFEKAEFYVYKAINIFKELNKEEHLAVAYSTLASIYEMTNKRKLALKTYLIALPYIGEKTDAKSLEYKEMLYYNIAWTMYNLKDYKAYEYLEKSYSLKDSLLDVNLRKELKKIEKTHNIDLIRKEEENKRLSLIRNNWFLGLGGVLLSLLFLYLAHVYKSKQKELKLQLSLKEFEQQKKLDDLQLESQIKIINAALDGKEGERKQIAENLHDNVSALLSSANMHLQATQKHFGENQPIELEKSKQIITEASQRIRDLSHNLVSSVLLKFGLGYALKDTAKKYSNSTIKIHTVISEVGRYAQDFEIKIYNIIQELINNVLKHSKAKTAYVVLEEDKDKLMIIVKDDGVGFNEKSQKDCGIGLNQIEARVRIMNGVFKIESSKGNGSKVILEIPIIKRQEITNV